MPSRLAEILTRFKTTLEEMRPEARFELDPEAFNLVFPSNYQLPNPPITGFSPEATLRRSIFTLSDQNMYEDGLLHAVWALNEIALYYAVNGISKVLLEPNEFVKNKKMGLNASLCINFKEDSVYRVPRILSEASYQVALAIRGCLAELAENQQEIAQEFPFGTGWIIQKALENLPKIQAELAKRIRFF